MGTIKEDTSYDPLTSACSVVRHVWVHSNVMTHTNSTSHTQKPSGVTSCFKIPSKLLTKSMKVLVLLLCVYTNAHVCAGPDVCASTYAYVSVCMLRSNQSPAFSSGTMHPLGRSVNEPQRSACLCLPSSGLTSISTMPALFAWVLEIRHRASWFKTRTLPVGLSPQPWNSIIFFKKRGNWKFKHVYSCFVKSMCSCVCICIHSDMHFNTVHKSKCISVHTEPIIYGSCLFVACICMHRNHTYLPTVIIPW